VDDPEGTYWEVDAACAHVFVSAAAWVLYGRLPLSFSFGRPRFLCLMSMHVSTLPSDTQRLQGLDTSHARCAFLQFIHALGTCVLPGRFAAAFAVMSSTAVPVLDCSSFGRGRLLGYGV